MGRKEEVAVAMEVGTTAWLEARGKEEAERQKTDRGYLYFC